MPSAKHTIPVLLLSLVVIVSVIYWAGDDNPPQNESHAYASLKRGDISATVSATGTLSPLVTVQVGSQVSGNIQQLMADFNSRVEKGEVIAQIEPSLFEAQRAQSAANLRSAHAALDKAGVGQRDAERQLERAKSLGARNMVSDSELDAAQLNHDQAVVELKVQQARVAEAKAALQLADVNLAHTTIYAPIDGIVISRDVDVGQTVAASLQAPTLFTIAKDLSKMQIETDVDEAFIGMVQQGQTAKFSVYAYPGRTFSGTLAQIRLNPDLEEQDVVTYQCIIRVDNEDLSLKPGMTATVSIIVGHRENVLKVANSALRFVPDLPSAELERLRAEFALEGDEALLWVLDNNELQPVKINVGLVAENETEIITNIVTDTMKVAIPSERKHRKFERKWGLQLF